MRADEARHSVDLFADHVMPALARVGAEAHGELLKAA
jgi:hypothetical protein